MVGLGQTQLHAKFEVATFSRCTNIKGVPQILAQVHAHYFMVGLAKSKPVTNFEIASFRYCRNIKG